MKAFPDFHDFEKIYAKRPQVMWTSLVSDLQTPVLAMLKLAGEKPNSFLLESVEGGAARGRYSFIGMDPDLIWRCFGDKAEINRQARQDDGAFQPCPGGTIASLRQLIADSRIEMPRNLPPMAAGLVGYLAYDTVRLVEKLPSANQDVLHTPDGIFLRPTIIAVFDNMEDKITVITPVWQNRKISAKTAFDEAQARLAKAIVLLEGAPPYPQHGAQHGAQNCPQHGAQNCPMTDGASAGNASGAMAELCSNMTSDDFQQMVIKAKDYILAGDILQVVLSQRFQAPFQLSAFSLYRALRRLNPSPFLYYLNFGGFSVVGSSPEILVRVRDGLVTIRPIAGTRRRGQTQNEDQALAEELLADPKELAEHLMLLDLGRNDVGRVAKVGTVKVTEQMSIERYSHVMHIVSNVVGELDKAFDAVDALLAGFPAGTVSGAPKVRAMEIIDELESYRRGIYAGCIGYFGANGEMDTCIALRTAVIKDGMMYVQAGGGIVADSDPEAERQESQNKAMALFRAAEEAAKFV